MQESHVSIVSISSNSASDTPQLAPPLKSKARRKQIIVLCLTTISYALNHALRTVWGYAKPYLADSNTYYTNPTLGYLDFSLTGAYAVGQYMNGSIGGWVNVKILLLAGSVFSIIGLCLFAGIEGFMSLNNYFVDFYAFIFTGLGQSTGYPSCVAIISNWISLQHKGLLFGLWGTSLNIGNIIGQQIGRFAINGEGLAWQYPILITCGIFGFFLVITMIFVQVHPRDTNRPHIRVSQETSNTQLQRQPLLAQDVSSETRQLEPIAFLEAWNERNVLFFALSAFSVKGVYSGITFWLPLYLTNQVHLQGDISLLLASVEIGMIIGSVVSGPLSDKIKSRASIIMIGFFFSIIFLISIYLIRDSQSKTLYFFLLLGAGVGMGGANSLIGGTVSSDIGQYLASKKGLNATSTMVGIMEGSGAIGGAITQLVISNFTNITFSFFAGLCFFGGCCLIPVVCREYTRART